MPGGSGVGVGGSTVVPEDDAAVVAAARHFGLRRPEHRTPSQYVSW